MAKRKTTKPKATKREKATKSTKGLNVQRPKGAAGPNLERLEKVVGESRELDGIVTINLPRNRRVRVTLGAGSKRVAITVDILSKATKSAQLPHGSRFTRGVVRSMIKLAAELPGGKVGFEEMWARGTSCPIDDQSLARLFVAAWSEALGERPPTEKELKSAQAHQAEQIQMECKQLIQDLRKRPKGKDLVNISPADARAARKLQERVDELRKIALRYGEFDLSKAKLAKANLSGFFSTG